MICRRGIVYLVGAGPGAADLITVRGRELLESADVVIHDRLVGSELLQYCREDALILNVGKSPDRHCVRQSEINRLLVHHARQGCDVVRLKGGDPLVFGRGWEEQSACVAEGIPCHIVPGISSAIAVPAAAGIPVTARGVARSFAVITGHTHPGLPDPNYDFKALAAIDTLAILMGRRNLRRLAQCLIAAGKSPDTPAACIQNGTLKNQRAVFGTLATIADIVESKGILNPMVTIIGQTVDLAQNDARDERSNSNVALGAAGIRQLWRRSNFLSTFGQRGQRPKTDPASFATF